VPERAALGETQAVSCRYPVRPSGDRRLHRETSSGMLDLLTTSCALEIASSASATNLRLLRFEPPRVSWTLLAASGDRGGCWRDPACG
jgi:hypothetical protein